MEEGQTFRGNEIALAFVSRIGLENLRRQGAVEAIRGYLAEFEAKLNESINIASSTKGGFRLTETTEGQETVWKTKGRAMERPSSQAPIEVQLLEHLAELRMVKRDDGQNGSLWKDHNGSVTPPIEARSRSFLEIGKGLLMEAKRESSWYSILDLKTEKESLSFDGIPRLAALVIVLARLEQYMGLESIVFPILFNNALYSFRCAFQSESSDVCTAEHPEWAISYIKNATERYAFLFKRVMNELKVNDELYFEALLNVNGGRNCQNDGPLDAHNEHSIDTHSGERSSSVGASRGTIPTISEVDLPREFSLACRDVCATNYLSSWCMVLANEVKLFVYSRMPLLMYEYTMPPSEMRLSLSELNGAMNGGSVVRTNGSHYGMGEHPDHHEHSGMTAIRAHRSSFANDITTSVAYALIRSLTDLAAFMRPLNEEASFELFADFDGNTIIPCIECAGSTISLNSQDECVYGFLDALLAMESHCTMRAVRQLLNEETIFEHVAPKGTLNISVYLQDEGHSAHMIDVVIKMLRFVDQRCRCLKLAESRGLYIKKVAIPLVVHFMDDVKQIWNSLDNVLESSTVSCMLLESCTFLYNFLLKYPESSFMSETLSSLDTMISKMMSIMKQCIMELVYEPLKHIHETCFTATYLHDKLLQMVAICNAKTHDKILKHSIECIERCIVSLIISKKYILRNQYQVDMTLENCLVILQMFKDLLDPKDFPNLAVLEDIVAVLSMDTDELETAANYLHLLRSKLERASSIGYGTDDEFTLDPDSLDYSIDVTSMQRLSSSDAFISGIMEDEFGVLDGFADWNAHVEKNGDQKRTGRSSDSRLEATVQEVQLKAAVPALEKIRALSMSQLYTLVSHILFATSPDAFSALENG